MTTRHAAISKTYGIHPIVAVDVANAAARLALSVLPNAGIGKPATALAIGHIVQQSDDKSLWCLRELPASNAANWNEWIYNPASKTYVDALVQGLDVKLSCRTIATANVALTGLQTINGVTLTAGEPGGRVLLTGQTNPAENGPWAAASGAWARATDANTSAEVTSGMFVRITEGARAGEGWVLTTADNITLGTTPLTFQPFDGVGLATQVTANTSSLLTKADRVQAPINYAGTALTLDGTHAEGYIRTTSALTNTITIPLNFAALDIGKYISGIQIGAGRTQFVKGDPSIVINCSTQLYTRTAGSPWTLYKAGANEYDLSGDLYL